MQYELFVIQIAALNVDLDDEVHLLKKTSIVYLTADEAFTEVLDEYANFADVFSPKLAAKFLEHMEINNHAIKLVDDWQPPYGPIYNLEPIDKLEILKAHIENNLANGFIRSSKFLIGALIFFDNKSNRSLKFCVDYQDLNHLTIKNLYLLPLVQELLDKLGWARHFTQIDLTNNYH